MIRRTTVRFRNGSQRSAISDQRAGLQTPPAKPVARNGIEGFLLGYFFNFFRYTAINVIYLTLLTEPQGKLKNGKAHI